MAVLSSLYCVSFGCNGNLLLRISTYARSQKNSTLAVRWSNSSINTHELDIMLVPDSMTPRLNSTALPYTGEFLLPNAVSKCSSDQYGINWQIGRISRCKRIWSLLNTSQKEDFWMSRGQLNSFSTCTGVTHGFQNWNHEEFYKSRWQLYFFLLVPE